MLSRIIRAYKDIYKIDKHFVWIQIGYGIFVALVPIITLFFSQQIVNALSDQPSWNVLSSLVIQALLFLCVTLFLRNYFDHVYTLAHNNFWQRIKFVMNEKLITMKYEYIEDSKVEQLKSNLRILSFSSDATIEAIGVTIRDKVKNMVTIILSVILLWPIFSVISGTFIDGWWIIFLVVCYFILIEWIIIKRGIKESVEVKEVHYDVFKANRVFNYLYNMLFNHEAGKEIRLYQHQSKVMQFVNAQIKDGISRIVAVFFKVMSKSQILSTLLHQSLFIILLSFVIIKGVGGNLGVGYIVSGIGAISLLIESVPILINQLLEPIIDTQPLELYYQFMDLPQEETIGSIPIEKRLDNEYELSLKDVSFAYPGSDSMVLKDINLDIEVGKSYAVVGENGSGKTTFIKLLTRLYPASKGEILLNNIDVLKYNPQEYATLFNVVFQDFALFSFNLKETIGTSKDVEESKMLEIIEEVGFKERFDKLDKGLDTILSKDFDVDGIQLSGGEQQKVALARALYKDGPIFILDEPTAALDPISEFEIYRNFQSIIKDKTSILISHRLSSCRFCDEIIVFDQGRIVQQGTHDELLSQDGKYQQLWNAQAQYYQEQDLDTSFLY